MHHTPFHHAPFLLPFHQQDGGSDHDSSDADEDGGLTLADKQRAVLVEIKALERALLKERQPRQSLRALPFPPPPPSQPPLPQLPSSTPIPPRPPRDPHDPRYILYSYCLYRRSSTLTVIKTQMELASTMGTQMELASTMGARTPARMGARTAETTIGVSADSSAIVTASAVAAGATAATEATRAAGAV